MILSSACLSINISSHFNLLKLSNKCDTLPMGIYQQYLRQKQKQRRRKSRNQKRSGIPNRVGIENRPKIADLKTEIGHWESDTVIGCNHTGVVVTHVDKASKYLLARLAKNKTMEEINRVTLKLFEPLKSAF